jgi:tRNA (mo5U34)-methyltransferase
MKPSLMQQRIDAVQWYHEFEFPGGLRASSRTADVADHRRVWAHIRGELDKIDFAGKTVLDLGCWDGYWSFYAEKRGAKRVLATDDSSQNWAGNEGLHLAKELLGSSVEIRTDVSVYDLTGLDRFDIVLCLGIYYHLIDPLYAFAQVRHCCHEGSIACFEGDGLHSLNPASHYDLSDHARPIFIPTQRALDQMLGASYFEVSRRSFMTPEPKRTMHAIVNSIGALAGMRPRTDRFLTVCRPFRGENPMHGYRPPFGLHQYDTRF